MTLSDTCNGFIVEKNVGLLPGPVAKEDFTDQHSHSIWTELRETHWIVVMEEQVGGHSRLVGQRLVIQ